MTVVYVETNFVQELVLEQEEMHEAESILTLAETRTIELVIPAFALSEPLWKLGASRSERDTLARRLNLEIEQLNRSPQRQKLAETFSLASDALVSLTEIHQQRFDTTANRLLQCARVLPLDAGVFEDAIPAKSHYGLNLQDSLVLASVLRDLKRQSGEETRYFVSKDRRGFNRPDLKESLDQLSCKYIGHFSALVQWLQFQQA